MIFEVGIFGIHMRMIFEVGVLVVVMFSIHMRLALLFGGQCIEIIPSDVCCHLAWVVRTCCDGLTVRVGQIHRDA
jgi:hypothetical protein